MQRQTCLNLSPKSSPGYGGIGIAGFVLLLAAMLLFGYPPAASCSDRPFNRAANWGGTGLMEIPNARIIEDGVIRAGATQSLPYRWYTVGMGILPGLEFSVRLTELGGVKTRQHGKTALDRALDVKYQILPESRGFPALAIGFHDFHGDAQQFPAQYLVMSRQVYPFDFTVGIGRKRLKGIRPPLFKRVSFLEDLGFFAGMEVVLLPRLHFMAEYNPIDYQDEAGGASRRVLPQGASLPFNFGLRFEVLPGVDLGVSYQRGDTLGVSIHMQALLGKPLLPRRPDPPLKVPVDRRPFSERDYKEMTLQISEEIHKAGFFNVSVFTDGTVLLAEFENSKYMSDVKAAGRVLRILLFHSPSDTRTLTAVAKRRDMPFLKTSVEPEHLRKYLLGEIPQRIFEKLLQVEFADKSSETAQGFEGTSDRNRFNYFWDVKPSFEMYFDTAGIWKPRLGVKPFATASAWRGGLLHGKFDIPFYSKVEHPREPFPNPVRSDAWQYAGRNYTFERLLVDQAFRLDEKTYARVSTGLFERMYGGVGGEVLRFLGSGRIAVGLESDFVRKRVPGTSFEFRDQNFYTILGNIYYRHPDPDITLRARVGRFMAGDKGVLFEFSRRYDTGVIVGGWYSFTDTDVFQDEFNRGYNHKGVFLSLPTSMFLRRDSAHRFSYSLSPWTRDVAATPAHWQSLFHALTDLTPALFRDNLGDIKE